MKKKITKTKKLKSLSKKKIIYERTYKNNKPIDRRTIKTKKKI